MIKNLSRTLGRVSSSQRCGKSVAVSSVAASKGGCFNIINSQASWIQQVIRTQSIKSSLNNYHINFKTLNSSTSDNNEEQGLTISEKEKPIYELLTIVSNSNRIAHTIYDNVHPFTTLLAQIEMMIKMLEELAQTQDNFIGDPIHETIQAFKELQITILCRRASCAMVCWRRAQTDDERNQYYQIMEQDYAKAFSFGLDSDELDFGYASFCKVVKQDLRQALHYVSKSIEANPKAPIKYLKRAELEFELFEHLRETGDNMRVEDRSISTGESTSTASGGTPESTAVTSFSVNSEWSDEALDTLNNCLIDCERYIEDTIQQAKEQNIKDYYLDYYVYNLRGRVFIESFLSDMQNAETSKVFIANGERDFTLFIDYFKPEEIDNLPPNYISEICSALSRRAMCRLYSADCRPEQANEDIERATLLLEKVPNQDEVNDITTFIEELKVLTQVKLLHNKATELGVKAASCQQTNPELALEYLNEAIQTCEISPLPMLYIQRAFLNYETFRKQTQSGMGINDPLNRQIMDKVAQDCQIATNLDPSPRTTEARIVLAEYYSSITGEKQKAVEQYEIVLKYYMQESDEQYIKTVEETLEKLKKELSNK